MSLPPDLSAIEIRYATESDIPELAHLHWEFHQSNDSDETKQEFIARSQAGLNHHSTRSGGVLLLLLRRISQSVVVLFFKLSTRCHHLALLTVHGAT